MKRLIFGKSGTTADELSPFHYLTRWLYTFANVKLHGESWREYRDTYMR